MTGQQQQEKAKNPPEQLKSEVEIKSGTTVCPTGTVHPSAPGSVACVPVTATAANTSATSNTAIYVTGSRIRRPNLESVVPITSVGSPPTSSTAASRWVTVVLPLVPVTPTTAIDPDG